MKTELTSELLSAYLDGEVTEKERAAVECALRDDPSARRLLEELRRNAAALGELPRHAAPPTLLADIEARLERHALLESGEEPIRPHVEHGSRRASRFAVAAMFGVVVLAGWWFVVEDRPGSSLQRGNRAVEGDVASRSTERIRESEPSRTERLAAATASGGAAGQTIESQLAAGVSPDALISQSFASETVRLQVATGSAVERDALASELSKRLSRRKAENLAARSRRDGASLDGVPSFFLVGKAGVNFADARQQQILVRVPRSEAAAIVDEVASAAGSEDRIELRAGPLSARGATTARSLLLPTRPGEGSAAVADDQKGDDSAAAPPGGPAGEPKGFDMLADLMKVVGLDNRPRGRPTVVATGPPADAGASANADENGKSDDARPSSTPMKEAEGPSPPAGDSVASARSQRSRSLVERRKEEAERSSKATEAQPASPRSAESSEPRRSATEPTTTPPPAAPSNAGEDYVTMVIEIVIPPPKPSEPPPAKNPTPARTTNTPR